MVLCEFWLILKANAIVLMIGGVLKEVITILVG
jgi:solute carrier family 35 protein C2